MKENEGRERDEMTDQAIENAIREWRGSHLELVLFISGLSYQHT